MVTLTVCMAAFTLLVLWAGGERKPRRLLWQTLLSTAVFMGVSISGIINNVIGHAGMPRQASSVSIPLAAAQILVLYVRFLLRMLGKRASRKATALFAAGLAAAMLASVWFGIVRPWYYKTVFRVPVPVLPEGQFAPMPELGEADFTVPADGTVGEVRDLIREAHGNGNEKHFTVLLEDGEYNITQIAFDARDHNTTYRSRDGGVILNGGMRLDPKDFTLWEKKNENIQVIDLTKLSLGPDDWGKLYSFGAFTTAGKYDDAVGPLPCELFVNGVRCVTARYPNGNGWLQLGRVLDNGETQETYENGTILNPEWPELRNPRSGTFAMDPDTAARVAGWASYEDVWVFGCFKFDWADMSTPIRAVDNAAGTLTTEYASAFGFEEGKTYYFYNVLEELDEPGEWYLDRCVGLLYLWPRDGKFDIARIDLSLSTETLITGENLKDLSFIGLTLQGTRSDGMSLSGDDLTVDHCVVRNLAGSAMSLNGYRNTASNNEIYRVGKKGISISGGDAATLTPGNSKAVNNLVHDWPEVVMTYQGGVNVYGTGNMAAHNELYNSPHTAMFFGGNNNVLEYNLIHDVCLDTDDAGAIYDGRSWCSAYGTAIRGNVIYDVGGNGYAPNGIYLDDGLSGVTVEDNLLVNVPGRVIALGGRDLTVRGNVVVNGGRPINYDEGQLRLALEGLESSHSREGGSMWVELFASPWQTDIWKAAFPKLAAITSDFSDTDDPNFAPNPAGSVISGNIIAGPYKAFYETSALRFSEIGPNTQYSAWKSRTYWTLPGYEKIPLEQVGRREE